MRYGQVFPYAGSRPLQEYFLGANDVGGGTTGASALTNPPTYMPNGVIMSGYDNYWGAVEFQYCYFNSTVAVWAPCVITPALVNNRYGFVASAVANTANQSRSMGLSVTQMAAGQYGWLAVAGFVPALSNASVAANASIGIAAAGQLGATSAGKEVQNMVSVLPATTTVTKNVLLTANSAIVLVTGNNTIDGLFIGCAISGTGIPAGSVVQSLDPDGRRFTMSVGPGVTGAPALATATGGIALTATYNDGTNYYNIVQLSRPNLQGRIT